MASVSIPSGKCQLWELRRTNGEFYTQFECLGGGGVYFITLLLHVVAYVECRV